MADQPPLAAHAAQAQSPSAGALNLDHAAHFVADIDAASAALQQMGFTLTPFSPQEHRLAPDLPLVAAGTANRCVMLQAGYLEFLCPVGDTPMAAQLQAAMARYVGVHLIAFGTAAPQADAARLQANGFAPLPIVDLQRTIGTADGERTARFTVVRVAPGRMAEGRIQYCQQRTPELLWQPRWLTHANGAVGLAAVIVCVAQPREAAMRYGAFTGVTASEVNGGFRLALERGDLIITDAQTVERSFSVTPAAMPWIAGYVLESSDLAAARNCARAAGCAVVEREGSRFAAVAPAAVGGLIVYQSPGAGLLELA
jgi:hypothetical protein